MRILIASSLIAVLVAGCTTPSANICTPPPPLDSVLGNQTDASSKALFLSQCVHRWSYRLARSSDPAPVVADGVMGACADLVFRAAYAREIQAQTRNESGQGFDSFTGESANHYVVTAREMRRLALFHVVAARAGNCPVPA